ncbi:MAG: C-GCAxxG-C-C family protein [Dehalococcoidia bacterium]
MDERPGLTARQALQSRIESYLLYKRVQCSQCVLLLLQDALGPYDPRFLAATRSLGRGIGGSGNLCGAVVAGVLALGLRGQSKDSGSLGDEGPPLGVRTVRPKNDWLDVFCPEPEEPALFARCRELLSRLSSQVLPLAGSLNCSDISGVEWSSATPFQLSLYRSPEGGMARCVEVIATTADTVRELLDEQPAGCSGAC